MEEEEEEECSISCWVESLSPRRRFESSPLMVVGSCRRVLTKSNGWNKTVEQNPENAPDKKDLMTGWVDSLIDREARAVY